MSAATPFPLIEVAGSPLERGRRYGRLARARIEVSLDIYGAAFRVQNLDMAEVDRRALAMVPEITAYDPALMAEIEGIAEGARIPVARIVMLNARTELLYGRSSRLFPPPSPDEGCTGAIALPEATADKSLIHGQNWDWMEACAESAIVLRADPEDGNPFITFVEAGMLGRAGFNAAGIALTGNFLASDRDHSRHGVPIPFIRRRILQSRDFAAAIGTVFEAPRAFSNNVMISDARGAAIDLEASPDEVFWLKPERGLIVHANHFKSPGALAKIRDVGILTSPDTLYRDDRVQARLSARIGKIDVGDFRAVLRDDFGAPKAVCRAPAPGPSGANSATVASIIMQPALGKMWIAPRPYLGTEFTEYTLAGRASG
jgi:isopenicillin-N N-acyltransferase-like protein